ncbi:MAG: cytochrome P450/NADPH-cytochrome P450 reductase [Pseudohongiellaceae bacterium]|jgi:cytochrome P450/NADPH-cytochrome P450 reductase
MKNPLYPIPKPSGNPLIGNMLSVDAKAPLQSLMELTRKLGPIYWLDMMGKPVIIASGPEIVKELSDETRFDKSVRGPLRRVRTIGGDGLFTSDTSAPNWSKAHNILMPTFSQQAMVDYLPQMIDIAEQLMLKWERLNADDEVDVARDMTGLTLDTVGLCGFDFRFNSFYREDFHPFIGALTRTLEISMLQRQLPFEDIALRSRLNQQKDDVSYMNTLVDDIISERRRSGGEQNDLLNFMLAGTDKVTGEGLSDENIRFQINTFLIAGHETTSGLLSFTLYYLLKHPDVLAKAYAEVDSVLGRDVAQPPTISQIGKLDYVRAILSESLRLWPTAPAFSLSPFKDEMVAGKYPLKKGSYITVLLPMLHRDKSVWGKDAEAFNPDNFSPEAEAARPSYAYKPFGNGQRACIGRQFAMQEAALVLGMILQRFQLFDHHNYELKIKETLSLKPDGFYIKVKLRPEAFRGESLATVQSKTAVSAAEEASIQRPNHGTKLYVLYGSNLGSTENLAREIASAGDLNGFDTTLATLDEYTANLPKDGPVVIASASYNGSAPDNAAKFVDWIKTANSKNLSGVQYAVFGCGNRDWASTYQGIPRLLDDRLAELGASRFSERVEGDAREGLDGTFQQWLTQIWPRIGQALALDIDFSAPVDKPPLYKVEVTHSVTANPIASNAGAMPMHVVENRELQNSDQSGRSTRHIVVELPGGLDYEPGDHLCVVGKNSPSTVARALARFGFDESSHIRVDVTGGRRSPFPSGSTFSVKRLAQVYGELQAVATQNEIATLLQHTRCPNTRSALEALANLADSDLYRSEVFIKRKSILDLLEEFPACELPFEIYMEMIPWMAPRYYSISSSNKASPGQCSVSVGVVEGPAFAGNGRYEGVCSTYLRDTQPGDTIQAVIKKPTNQFRLPEDPAVPILMVGPGTGVAPFIGFIQERKALKDQAVTLGDAHLFFGCRHPDQDFIYRTELELAQADNLVQLHTAFSRLTEERVYVQDSIKKNWSAIWPLLQSNAVIYICGDGAMMEPDVRNTLIQLYMEETNVPQQQGQAWLEQLGREGRYVLDVWAG